MPIQGGRQAYSASLFQIDQGLSRRSQAVMMMGFEV